jgi:hypothetical protein
MGMKFGVLLHIREEHRFCVLEGEFGPKREEVTGEWSKLHNEELNNLYFSPNTIGITKS